MGAAGDSVDVLLHDEIAPLAQSDASPLVEELGPNATSQVKDVPAYAAPDGGQCEEAAGEDVPAYVAPDGGEETAHDSIELEGHYEPDVEVNFVDAERLPSNGNVQEPAGSLPIRAPVSNDVEDEDGDEEAEGEVVEEEGSSVSDESYDSALERIAVASPASVLVDFPNGIPVSNSLVEDAEVLSSSGNVLESAGSLPIRAPLSDDLEEDDYEDEGAEGEEDEGSFVSDGSALEQIAAASTVDAVSPVGISVDAPNGVPAHKSDLQYVDADLNPVSGPEVVRESVACSGTEKGMDEFEVAGLQAQEHGKSVSDESNDGALEPIVVASAADAASPVGVKVDFPNGVLEQESKPQVDADLKVELVSVPEAITESVSGLERSTDEVEVTGLQTKGNGKSEQGTSEHVDVVNLKQEPEKSNPITEDKTGINAAKGGEPALGTPSLGGAGPSLPLRPAGLGRSVPSLEPASRVVQRSSGTSLPSRGIDGTRQSSDVSEGNDEAQEKLQMIRVKFLRLAHRLGQSAHNVVVAQVLYRLGLAEQLRGGRSHSRTGAFSFERASILAEEQEAAGQDELDFGCTIMVLGKSGVGKSATINSIFDDLKSGTDAYSRGTKTVREIMGTIHGIKLRVIDTPGLLPSFADQRHNAKIMSSVKHLIRRSPPDIVLYFDRLDMQSRDYGDLPLLRTITDAFGAAIWFNAIVVLTHASSAPPDGANGVPLSYEMFVAQRSHVVQQTIRQAAGDMRLMNPVSLVENHAACRTNRAGDRVLPNGQVWKPQLLLLCFASKILAEANSLLKLQESSPGKPFGVRSRVPPLPFLLSSLLQSRAQLKFPDEQMVDDDEFDEDSEEEGVSDGEEEYDDLPPFRRLTREELGLLDDEQRKIYFEELNYREKLFMKQQWKEERLRRKEMKRKMAVASREESHPLEEGMDEDNAGSAAVPVPMPDMALPPSFDADNPSHRYRYLDTASQWLVRPVLETHGWDHDSGYDGLNIEKTFVILNTVPASISGQVTKDKKEANLQMECAASFKNGEGKVTLAGLDVQTIGKDLAYTLRSETRFSNFRRNKTTCGLALTFLGDTMAAGMKLEDRLMVGKRLKLVLNGGAITGRGDVAYGGSLEATLRDKDYPIVQTLSTLGLSIMDWHGDLAIGGNFQSQFMLGKNMMIARANLNNRGAGQISIRASSSEQVQMALIGLIPLLRAFIGNRFFSSSQPM